MNQLWGPINYEEFYLFIIDWKIFCIWYPLTLQKKLDQLPAVDIQHAPAKLPSKLHMFAYVDFLAQWLCSVHSDCAVWTVTVQCAQWLCIPAWLNQYWRKVWVTPQASLDFQHVNCRQLSMFFPQCYIGDKSQLEQYWAQWHETKVQKYLWNHWKDVFDPFFNVALLINPQFVVRLMFMGISADIGHTHNLESTGNSEIKTKVIKIF